MLASPEMRGAAPALQALLLAATILLVGASLFHGGAGGDGSILWIGGAAVLCATGAAALVALGRAPLPALGKAGWACLGLLTAFVAWNGVSIWWSIQPSRSWDFLNRGAVYLALACLAMLAVAGVPRALGMAAGGLAALLGLVLAWALLGKIVPGLGPDPRIARLRSPIGYWNQLALLADGAVVLGLWLAARRRVSGVVLLYGALVAVVLTYSRSGIALAALVALAWLAARPERFESIVALAIGGAAAACTSAVALALPGVSESDAAHRGRDGAIFGVVLVLLGAAAAAGARPALAARVDPGRRAVVVRGAAVVAAAVVVAALAGVVARDGGPGRFVTARWDEFTSTTQYSQSPGRVAGFSSSGRWSWWQEAWHTFLDEPVAGTGAGTFQLADRRRRQSAVTTIEPHNTPLQFLGETGIVGFGLWLGAAVAAAVAIGRRRYEEPAAATALALAALAFLVHSFGDIDWSFLATQAPLFVILGALLGAGVPARAVPRSRLGAAAAAAVAFGLVYSLAAPWLANRRLDESVDAFVRGDYVLAAARARSAHSLNPLDADPVTQEAAAEEGLNNAVKAYALYIRAVRLEPENPDTWFDLGQFQLLTLHDPRAAFDSLNRAYTLDPHGAAAERGGLLDQARCQAFQRLCERASSAVP